MTTDIVVIQHVELRNTSNGPAKSAITEPSATEPALAKHQQSLQPDSLVIEKEPIQRKLHLSRQRMVRFPRLIF